MFEVPKAKSMHADMAVSRRIHGVLAGSSGSNSSDREMDVPRFSGVPCQPILPRSRRMGLQCRSLAR